jgi:tRNA (mo5U34)-methyltransferase
MNATAARPTVGAEPEADLRARIDALGPWFHNIRLGGIETAPDHFLGDYPNFKFQRFAAHLPSDLTGKSVLDIGCNAGFYSMEMKRRGADYVVGIDTDERYLGQARFAAETLGYRGIEFQNLSVYDVGALGRTFDVVIFMGVLYHLRHPLLALDLIREHVAGDMLVFQSLQRGSTELTQVPEDHPFYVEGTWDPPSYFDEPGYPKLHFVEREYAHDWTNWWIPNRACAEAMLRSAGFRIETQAEDEVYICRRAELPYGQWMKTGAVYPQQGRTTGKND